MIKSIMKNRQSVSLGIVLPVIAQMLSTTAVVNAFATNHHRHLWSSTHVHSSSSKFGGFVNRRNASPGKFQSSTALQFQDGLPSIDQVLTDPFADQIYYASVIVRELFPASSSSSSSSAPESSSSSCVEFYNDFEDAPMITSITNSNSNNDDSAVAELLEAQLSHQDGIRGFFSVYLTQQGDQHNPADQDHIPPQLMNVLKRSNFETLAPMLCMNVIRPTAMASMHTDPIFAANSQKIAQRGAKLLSSFKGSINVIENCKAIMIAASSQSDDQGTSQKDKKNSSGFFFAEELTPPSPNPQQDDGLVLFWEAVFEQDGYNKEQKECIAKMFSNLI